MGPAHYKRKAVTVKKPIASNSTVLASSRAKLAAMAANAKTVKTICMNLKEVRLF